LGIKTIILLTNNTRKLKGLNGNGILIEGRISIPVEPNEHNRQYLRTKKKKLSHLI